VWRAPLRETVLSMAKIFYKPFGLIFSVLGGILAGAVFKKIWSVAGREDEAPEATDATKGWGEILVVAAAEGAVFGGVRALIDRAGATGFARLTGAWPGRTREQDR
jgi:hypothetical protein